MKVKPVTVRLDESTHRWLSELAKANSNTELNPGKINMAQLLAKAAFCFADHAGRREGSWEADVGRNLLLAAGYQQRPPALRRSQLARWEEQKRQAWLESRRA